MTAYRVVAYDNNHYTDESERTNHDVFGTAEEAVAACKAIVDEDLNTMWKPGTSEKELYELFLGFGQDAFAVPLTLNAPDVDFSACTYAKERCKDLVKSGRSVFRP